MATNAYLTPLMIRTFLLDRSATDNFLLDEVEMSTELIDLAMIMVVDRYNTTTPILNEGYSEQDFPYKAEFLLGIAAFLLNSKGLNLARNALPYSSTSGSAVDDSSNKSRLYLQMSKDYYEQFDERIKQIKQHKNIQDGFGFVSGPPRYGSF